jgi:DNA-binding transcriptional ArsR family regulator
MVRSCRINIALSSRGRVLQKVRVGRKALRNKVSVSSSSRTSPAGENCRFGNMNINRLLRAVADDRRVQILKWLQSPIRNFPPQADGDLSEDGVCGLLLAQKLGVSQSIVSKDLRVLSRAGLVRGKRVKRRTFYKPGERCISDLKKWILDF